MPALRTEELFDAQFLESVLRLRIVARRVPRGGRFAEQRSADLGGGVDFRDFRQYSPGDDFRSIDWNLWERLGKVFLRLYEELEDLPVYLLPDVSRSLWIEDPPRIVAGLRATLALAAIALGHHDTVSVFPFADDLSVLVRSESGKSRVLRLAERLSSIEPPAVGEGRTDIARSLRRLASYSLRRGLLVVVSDFFDEAGVDRVVEALGSVRHRMLLVQLTRASDREPAIEGDLRLVDCESGSAEDVAVSERTLARYRDAYDRFETTLGDFARRRGAGMLRLDCDLPVAPQLARLFESGGELA